MCFQVLNFYIYIGLLLGKGKQYSKIFKMHLRKTYGTLIADFQIYSCWYTDHPWLRPEPKGTLSSLQIFRIFTVVIIKSQPQKIKRKLVTYKYMYMFDFRFKIYQIFETLLVVGSEQMFRSWIERQIFKTRWNVVLAESINF